MMVNSKLVKALGSDAKAVASGEQHTLDLPVPTILFDGEANGIYIKLNPQLMEYIRVAVAKRQSADDLSMFDILRIWKQIKPLIYGGELNVQEI